MKRTFTLLLFIITSIASNAQQFITRSGTILTLGGSEIHLRGVVFGNEVWENVALPTNEHDESDFRRVQQMGMNAIRFNMNYITFEDDSSPYVYKQAGWNWLDTNMVWAQRHNIYLILNIHVPQGGFQSNCNGTALWTNPENQNRLSALWKAIAQRYANEPQIAGYDLLNEPIPVDSIGQWQALAQRLRDSIRTVDNNHMIIAENAIALNCNYAYADARDNFPLITENNLMYTSHIYEPYNYTYQLQAWAGTGDGGKYPDETVIQAPADITYCTGQYNNPQLPAGTTGWTYYKGVPYTVTGDSIIIATPIYSGNNLGSGIAYFDSITINEVDNSGNIVRQIFSYNIPSDTNCSYWSQNSDGAMATASIGYTDNTSISITGSSSYANITDNNYQFKVQQGKSYTISGWMKGSNIMAGSNAYLSLGFYYSPSGSPVLARDYNFLETRTVSYSRYPVSQGYPVYFGEFGAVRPCFENGKGGDLWVKDMLHIFDSLGFNWTYHDYNNYDNAFGIYSSKSIPVDTTTGITSLISVFENYFGVPLTVTAVTKPNNKDCDIKLFPNPSAGAFKVVVTGIGNTKIQLTVTDMLGRELATASFEESYTFGENLPAGIYICSVKTGTENFVYKLYKE